MCTLAPAPSPSPRAERIARRERRRRLTHGAQTVGALALIVAGVYAGLSVAADIIEERQIGPSITFEPCATEDDPGPCYWDADRGNGTGRSFIADNGDVLYLSR